MKAITLFSGIVLFLFAINLSAQVEVQTEIVDKEMSQGVQTAFKVFVPEAEPRLVEQQWKRFINERSFFEFAGKGTSQSVEKAVIGISNLFSKEKKSFDKKSLKVQKTGNELLVENVIHEDITNDHLDVFATIAGTAGGVNLFSYYRYADSVFINNDNTSEDIVDALLNYTQGFGEETYRIVVKKQIFEAEKELKKQEGELKNLERKNKAMHRSIAKDEVDIDEFHHAIGMVEGTLESYRERIDENKRMLRELEKKTPEYEMQRDVVKELEKGYKKERNKIKSNKRRIKRNQNRIKKTKSDIEVNEKEQEAQLEVIKRHEAIVAELEKKHDAI